MSSEIRLIADAVRARRVSAAEVIELTLQRIDRLNPALNAVVARCDDAARRDARRVDDQISDGQDPGPLAGVPVLVKDLEDVQGMRTTQGSLLFADSPVSGEHSTVPGRLTSAGGVIVGKTNLPEFATEGYTANEIFGATNNPWALDHSPGGSSGGSAAAVAAGLVPIATATDGGGSIRIPAAFCGLVGIKPTNGVIGRWPAPDWIDLSTEGPFATSAEDLRILWEIEAGPVAGDPTAVVESAVPLVAAGGRPSRLFVTGRFGSNEALPADLAAIFEAATSDLSEVLAIDVEPVDPVTLFGGTNPDLDWFTVTTAEHVARFGRDWVAASLDRMHPGARGFMEWGLRVTIDEYLAARRRRFGLIRALDQLLGADALLVSPTVAASGWLADGRLTSHEEPGMLPPDAFNTATQNITGHPALSLPAGRCANGVPFGLQVTGPRYRDGMLLDVASIWQEQRPWPRVAPGYQLLADSLGLL